MTEKKDVPKQKLPIEEAALEPEIPKDDAPAESSITPDLAPKIESVPSTTDTTPAVQDVPIGTKDGYSPIKWSILILTQPDRSTFLKRLLDNLGPQILNHVPKGDVEYQISVFDPKMTLGENRQKMYEEAKGTYVSFVDDDDLVAQNYVSKIYPLLDGVDYVGFKVQLYTDGQQQKPTFHSLRYPEWTGDAQGWYRDISHLNPIRRSLALKVKMSGGHGEDHRWANELRALHVVNTEHYIDEIMYHYYYRSAKAQAAQKVQVETHSVGSAPRKSCCPKCGSTSQGMAGGMRHCNQCGNRY